MELDGTNSLGLSNVLHIDLAVPLDRDNNIDAVQLLIETTQSFRRMSTVSFCWRCFPAAHASSGYALLALYFVLRERSRRAARAGLATGLVMGLAFGIAQQARGAHFVSHDVWSAMIVWTVSLSLYTVVFKARLWNSAALERSRWECNEPGAAARRVPVDGDADLPCRAGAAAGS